MKASDLILEPPARKQMAQRLCRDFQAKSYVTPAVFERFVAAGWLKPVTKEHKLTLFDYVDLDECVDRMKAEGLPK